MNIGIIARCDPTGLGIQSKEFFDHIECSAFVMECAGMPQHHDWYPGQTFYRFRHIGVDVIPDVIVDNFLRGLDVLVAFETPYDFGIFRKCRERGIKSVLQLNYEFLDYPSNYPLPDLFAAPSKWHYDQIPDPKVFLPVPSANEKFSHEKKQNTFLHIAGKKAIHDRNGTQAFLESLQYVENYIDVTVRSQQKFPIPDNIPSNVNITYDFENKENYWENYTGGVLVLPRKYGGLSLPLNEALAASMPVIMPDISPNNLWLPSDWLVPANHSMAFKAKKHIDVFEIDRIALARKIDNFCESNFYDWSYAKASALSHFNSWELMKPKYLKLFEDLVAGNNLSFGDAE